MNGEVLAEPELEFGGGGHHIDIRFGLNGYGPFDRWTDERPQQISLGIVGTAETAEGMLNWLRVHVDRVAVARRKAAAGPSSAGAVKRSAPAVARESAAMVTPVGIFDELAETVVKRAEYVADHGIRREGVRKKLIVPSRF